MEFAPCSIFLTYSLFSDCFISHLNTQISLCAIITDKFLFIFLMISGDGEIRTLDPLLARQVLSQLSYTPIFSGLKWTRTIDLTLIRRAL